MSSLKCAEAKACSRLGALLLPQEARLAPCVPRKGRQRCFLAQNPCGLRIKGQSAFFKCLIGKHTPPPRKRQPFTNAMGSVPIVDVSPQRKHVFKSQTAASCVRNNCACITSSMHSKAAAAHTSRRQRRSYSNMALRIVKKHITAAERQANCLCRPSNAMQGCFKQAVIN